MKSFITSGQIEFVICIYGSDLRLRYLLQWLATKAQTSLRICAVLPEPLFLENTKYRRSRRNRPKNRPLPLLDMSEWEISCLPDSSDFCRLPMIFANSLDLDQA